MSGFLNREQIDLNKKSLQALVDLSGCDYFYCSSFDIYLNEYVSLHESHRYHVSGFTGSVAEVLLPPKGKGLLFIDGRYQEQVKNEVSEKDWTIHLSPPGISTLSHLESWLKKSSVIIGYDPKRTPLGFINNCKHINFEPFSESEFDDWLLMEAVESGYTIEGISKNISGEEALSKCKRLIAPRELWYISALDSIAWISNSRGYYRESLSSYPAQALITAQGVKVFVPSNSLPKSKSFDPGVSFYPEAEFEQELKKLLNKANTVFFSSSQINHKSFLLLESMAKNKLVDRPLGFYEFQCLKNDSEIAHFKQAFEYASKAIWETRNWVRESLEASREPSEKDLFLAVGENYKKNSALGQSFKTIAATGENSAIIHYGTPSEKTYIKPGGLVLIDSGGYFEGGYATDCTRAFLSAYNEESSTYWKRIYSAVLKGQTQAQMAIFPIGTEGRVIDSLARSPIRKLGFDYNHGTGHGVGVHVHEPGTRIHLSSSLPLQVGNVVSLEPGIYIPGVGGVRIENVVAVKEHPEYQGFCYFEPLNYTPLEEELIDWDSFNKDERDYIENYQAKALDLCKRD